MTQKYYSFVTNLGLGQITNAVVLGGKVDLKYFAVGDGGGESYTPDPSMTTLKNEVWRGNITGYRIDSESQNDIFITGIVPANVGGFTIREMAAFDSNGTMIAIATLADIVKPTVDEGESADAELTIHITVENSEVLNCTIDPNVIVATKADVKKMGDSIKNRFGQPNGIATLDGNGKLVQMPTAEDVAAIPLSQKGIANGIATLNSSGKLAQMPTAADVGAIKLHWSTLINETTETPNKYNFDDYITPGDVVSVDNYASAQSIANIPEAVPGKLYVLPLRTDNQGRNDIMQEYHTVTGNVYTRPRYYYSSNTWSDWSNKWITPTLNAPFTPGTDTPVTYRKYNNMVTIRGWVLTLERWGTIFTLPDGYRPTQNMDFVTPQSETAGLGGVARIHIKSDGTVRFSSSTYETAEAMKAGCALNVSFAIN